jgi:hypothetical protein
MPFNTGITRREFIGITAAATGSILCVANSNSRCRRGLKEAIAVLSPAM